MSLLPATKLSLERQHQGVVNAGNPTTCVQILTRPFSNSVTLVQLAYVLHFTYLQNWSDRPLYDA